MEFCSAHQRVTAKADWEARGYPEIKWEGLTARAMSYRNKILRVIDGQAPSHFRSKLEKAVQSGKNRNMAQSIMTDEFRALTPGYYGSRGGRILMEAIMTDTILSSALRKQAASDKLISSGGVSAYVQAVLVPELAIWLVQGDMGVDEVQARQILQESIDIGDLLNEEENEDIILEDDAGNVSQDE